jgi:hypothetical protein
MYRCQLQPPKAEKLSAFSFYRSSKDHSHQLVSVSVHDGLTTRRAHSRLSRRARQYYLLTFDEQGSSPLCFALVVHERGITSQIDPLMHHKSNLNHMFETASFRRPGSPRWAPLSGDQSGNGNVMASRDVLAQIMNHRTRTLTQLPTALLFPRSLLSPAINLLVQCKLRSLLHE